MGLPDIDNIPDVFMNGASFFVRIDRDPPGEFDDLRQGFNVFMAGKVAGDLYLAEDTGAVFTLGRSRFADNIASHFFIRKDPVVTIACGDEHSAVVCQSGRLFVFGSNDWGQLGLGHKNHVSKPSCVKSLKPERVTHVACGRAHTLICTDGQKIFACGSDQESQLGRGPTAIGDSSSSPIMVYDCGLAGPQVQQIAAGSHHSLVLTNDGGVIAWGSNLEGQLGLHGVSGLINTPTKVHIPEPVKQISAGYYHSAFLTGSGLVYVCGEAESGKLGIVLDFRTQLAPKPMSLSVKAAHVACGGHHTLLLGEDGNIYCTGSNASGQLGMGSTVTEIQTPKQLQRGELQDETITKLVCGESHIAVVTGSGKLFTCGDGRHGKLGLEENENNVHELTYAIKYQELFVTNVACGGCHTILVGRRRTENGDEETKQMKISPLPPLKVPVSRIQNDSPVAKPESPNIHNNQENDNGTPEEIVNDTVEETKSLSNAIEKPESPKQLKDYSESEETKVKEDEMTNEKSHNDENKNETTNNTENELKDDNENKTDNENKNESEMQPEETVNHKDEDQEKPDDAERPKSSVSRVGNVDPPIEENGNDETKANDENSNEAMSEEKSESPPLPVPPPKPPRQKTGSAGSVSTKSESHSVSRSSGEVGPNADIKPEVPDEMEKNEEKMSEEKMSEEKMSEMGSDKKSAGSEKSQSNKSKADSDETAPFEAVQSSIEKLENMGEKAVEAVAVIEEKIDMAADDADVVQSPPPRAGKISKLFHLKKAEVENGNKLSPPNAKAKSKTCSIL